MDITQLQYFKIIAETGSLTKAAEALHVSQPAMSAMLKKFEGELNAELFDRSPNRISLNQTGKIALVHVNNILRNVEQMKTDVQNAALKNLSLRISFCDPSVRLFCIPRFSVAHPEITIKDGSYEGTEAAKLLTERVYDLVVAPQKIHGRGIASQRFLSDQVLLSVPKDSDLAGFDSISIKDIPAQPLLYPQIGGYFLSQIDKLIDQNALPITLVKNEYNTTQYLIRTTKFLATASTLSRDRRNDGTQRIFLPMNDPELNVIYYISYLKAEREKVQKFLDWAKSLSQA